MCNMKTFKLEGREYDMEQLSPEGLEVIKALKIADKRLKENVNSVALLTRAKQSYIAEIKKEILSSKAGLNLEGDF